MARGDFQDGLVGGSAVASMQYLLLRHNITPCNRSMDCIGLWLRDSLVGGVWLGGVDGGLRRRKV